MKNKELITREYSNVYTDDFAGTNIKTIEVPENYLYINKNIFYRIAAFILYYFIAVPILWIYQKVCLHQKFINKKVIKKCKNSGFFVYANHVMIVGDAIIPNTLCLHKNYIIVNPDAVSIKGVKTIVKMLGALPLPTSVKGSKYFLDAIDYRTSNKQSVTIYPEAHIWPYYTAIRPFYSASFKYPITFDKPSFCVTNVFVKSKNPLRKKPVVRSYVDGPFYHESNLSKSEAAIKLRDSIYETMVKRNSLHKPYKYKYDYVEKIK